MIHTNNPIIQHQAGLLNVAEQLGNVSKACKIMGVSQDTCYRYQEWVEADNIDQLIYKNRRAPAMRCENPAYLCRVVGFTQFGYATP